MEFPSMLVKLN
jgi:hypothetical protein